MEKKRYFLVFYKAIHEVESVFSEGYMDMITKKALYLNRYTIIEIIKERNPEFKQVVLTNIIELSERDYKNWII